MLGIIWMEHSKESNDTMKQYEEPKMQMMKIQDIITSSSSRPGDLGEQDP